MAKTEDLIARPEYGMCRVVNHTWQRSGLERQGRDVMLVLECASCGTERLDLVSLASGDVERTYRYPADYVHRYEKGEHRPYKSEYRREWMRVLLEEETGRLIRMPKADRRAARRRSA